MHQDTNQGKFYDYVSFMIISTNSTKLTFGSFIMSLFRQKPNLSIRLVQFLQSVIIASNGATYSESGEWWDVAFIIEFYWYTYENAAI